MLNLLVPLSDELVVFNLFRYLTFRTGGAVLTALLFAFVFGPRVIARLRARQREGQPIRSDGPETHLLTKQGTPTMGGVLILSALTVSTLLWADLSNAYVWIVLFVTIGFGLLGAGDDYLKLTKRSHKGLSARLKLVGQLVISAVAIAAIVWLSTDELRNQLAVPFLKNVLIDLGLFFAVFALVVMIGASNAVNLTDGLDGLAIVPVMIAASCFALIAYLVGNIRFADYLQIHYVAGTGELAVFCGALVGAGLGFLWFNAPPAMVFMGDTGSLSCGGAIGTIAVIVKHELVLAIIGGLFVLETV
ncbi:MAG: phospho-N-acetylmuramoyl-pentapeptide-transferase, partial [Tistlia sp.]|uniref:phospho-N-acetylmuramoyl-pentapeptide- transferase n=1 Tax=Tistlia sp. TaxID=3057121 RepID=UPI0034A4472E